MVEYTTENMPKGVKSHRANTVGFSKDDSPNYAGKERVNGGMMHGGWTTITYIGDRLVSKETTYLNV